ncbi:MAG: type I-E CRISPR-associated protein Cse1/CasA [Chloroflexi bacterium]|nr:type I-E CRISPR-associated protein Cse1/CasA [Chloroflexota bacterium]
MAGSYNLLKESWIPCVMPDGSASELSLRDVLVRAQEIREVSDPSPLTTASIHRLLLAVLYRIFAPQSIGDWLAIWESDGFSAPAVDEYLERWNGRFDLLDKDYPFYQTSLFSGKTKIKAINDMIPELTQGHTSTLFDHTMDDECPPISLAQSARMLVTIQAYMLGGTSGLGQNYRDGPGARSVTFCLLGENLFRSLLLNLIPASSLGFPANQDDKPVWEHDNLPVGNTPSGILDYLTWQTLKIRLSPSQATSPETSVEEATIGLGRDLAQDNLLSPFSRYHKDAKRGWLPMRLREDRSLWRDASTLLAVRTSSDDVNHPACLRWAAALTDDGHLPFGSQFALVAFGQSANQAKINFWRTERMPVPMEYLADEALVELLGSAITKTEMVGSDLRNAVTEVALNIVDSREEAYKVRDHMSPLGVYWASLEAPFYELLSEIPIGQEESLKTWSLNLKRLAWDSFESATNGLSRHPRALKATAMGSARLARGLATTLAE